MKYYSMLKELFKGISLHPEDLLLLETFQIKYLKGRALQKEFSTVIRAYPFIQRFLISKYPPIKIFIQDLLKGNEEINDKEIIKDHCDKAIWEIADLIVYNKHPEIYDEKVQFTWKLNEIVSIDSIKGKVVADVGSGSGFLTFLLAKHTKTVYAVEPVTSLRNFIREKTKKQNYSNIYTMDGFLHSIPLPDNSIDYLFTSNAMGWDLQKELPEIDRVVKPNGQAIHLFRSIQKVDDNPFHDILISSNWKYDCMKFQDGNGIKLKYSKIISGNPTGL